MSEWKPGDRVAHATFGPGTIIAFDGQHAVIHFDDHGRKKFASHMVVLTPTSLESPHGRQTRTIVWPSVREPAVPVPTQTRSVFADAPSSIDQLIDLARRKVGSEDSLNEFVTSMRNAMSGPSHPHVGVLSGMRVQEFQNWLLDENPKWQLTDAQLLAVMRVEFPVATGQVHTGDVDTGLRQVAGIRASYNRDGHTGPSPTSRGMPYSVSYGRF
jgi:hypothetical protein